VCAAPAAIICCQAVAGITDRELDPAWNQQPQPPEDYTRRPPDRPAADAGAGTGVKRTFAVQTIYLGTVDPVSKKEDTTVWKRIGYDLDGKCTTAAQSQSDSSGVCKKPAGAQAESLEDGDDCRDNAAGKLMSQGTVLLAGDFELQLNQKLQLSQTPGIVLVLDDLADGPDDASVPGAMYITVPNPTMPPLWNGMDDLFVDPSCVTDGRLDKPRYAFPKGYMKNHVWVSNDFNDAPGPMPLMLVDRLTEVTPIGMTLTAQLNKTHDGVLRSVLGVVLDMTQVKKTFGPIFNDTLCNELQTALLMNQYLMPNADLAAGPIPFINADKTCDAMSYGSMFEWVLIKNLGVALSSPPLVAKCDAGTPPVPDAAPEVGTDAPKDAVLDLSTDALLDAPIDTASDAAESASPKD
jgi:hypothetical protein